MREREGGWHSIILFKLEVPAYRQMYKPYLSLLHPMYDFYRNKD